eukprot:UN03047
MAGIGMPLMMMAEYSDVPSGVPVPERATNAYARLNDTVPARYIFRSKHKLVGAYDTHCKSLVDTYKACAHGFMYDPESIIRCAAEFSQMRSCMRT